MLREYFCRGKKTFSMLLQCYNTSTVSVFEQLVLFVRFTTLQHLVNRRQLFVIAAYYLGEKT